MKNEKILQEEVLSEDELENVVGGALVNPAELLTVGRANATLYSASNMFPAESLTVGRAKVTLIGAGFI